MKIFKVTSCSACPNQYWQNSERKCGLSHKIIWDDGGGKPASEFPEWCKLDDWQPDIPISKGDVYEQR